MTDNQTEQTEKAKRDTGRRLGEINMSGNVDREYIVNRHRPLLSSGKIWS